MGRRFQPLAEDLGRQGRLRRQGRQLRQGGERGKAKIKDLDSLKANFPGIGKECGGCHETYRVKKADLRFAAGQEIWRGRAPEASALFLVCSRATSWRGLTDLFPQAGLNAPNFRAAYGWNNGHTGRQATDDGSVDAAANLDWSCCHRRHRLRGILVADDPCGRRFEIRCRPTRLIPPTGSRLSMPADVPPAMPCRASPIA